MRRRMMMDTKPAQDWDVVWDYTMGMPEENGFEKAVAAAPKLTLDNDGLHVSVSKANDYVRYIPIGYEACNEGIYEETVVFLAVPTANGNRMILSDGNSGLQIYVYAVNSSEFGIFYEVGGEKKYIKKLNLNEEYTIRVERVDNMNTIYVNSEEIYRSAILSTNYVTGNRIFFQNDIVNSMEAILKSIKFKKIS